MTSKDEKYFKDEPKVRFDLIVTNRLGEFGKYQKEIYILLGLPAIVYAFHTLAWVFVGANVPYRCRLIGEDFANASYHSLPFGREFNESFPYEIGNDGRGRWSQCLKYDESIEQPLKKIVDCEGKYIYDDSQYKTTARMDFQLVCDNKYWYTVAETLYKAGVMVGAIVFGGLSDRLGRRPVFFFTLCLQVTFGIVTALAPNYTTFVISRFFLGMAGSGMFIVAFVIAMELVGTSKRMIAAMGMQYFWTLGFVLEGIIAFFIREWRYFQLAISIPGLLFLSYYWFMPESIRWLLAHGKKAEAVKILKKAAAINKITIPESELARLNEEDMTEKKPVSLSIREIIKYRKTMLRSLNVFSCWLVNSFVYYGLALNSGNLGGNDYVNFILSGLVEVPAYAILIMTLNRFGRKKVLCGCMISAGVSLVICGFIPSDLTWLIITFNMIGKLFNAGGYAAIYMYSAELFPTVIRNSFMGISSLVARVGSILSDYVILAQVFWKPLPHLIFGSICLATGLLSLLLPETLGKRLPDTMDDGEKFGTCAYDNAETMYEEEEATHKIKFPDKSKESKF